MSLPPNETMPEDKMPRECAAFPTALRWLCAAMFIALVAAGVCAFPALYSVKWTPPSLLLLLAAWVCIAWMGYWLLQSRTRIEGDTLVQTWLWTKRIRASDVVQMKLVHIRALEAVLAPRLLVRRRGGSITWFHAADADVLRAFMMLTLHQQTPK